MPGDNERRNVSPFSQTDDLLAKRCWMIAELADGKNRRVMLATPAAPKSPLRLH